MYLLTNQFNIVSDGTQQGNYFNSGEGHNYWTHKNPDYTVYENRPEGFRTKTKQ